jgi:hypothetical protein
VNVSRISLVLLTAAALALGLLAARAVARYDRAAISCTITTSGATNVGTISSVPSAVAQVDSSSAFTGKQLKNRNAVCTSTSGQVKYTLKKTKTTYCNSGTPPHASKVQLYPPSGVIAHWISGWSWCHATGKADVTYSASGKANLKTNDPLFGVFVNRDQSTTAKVALGFLDVSGEGKRSTIVGPSQQITVPAGGEPGPVERIELTDGDRATIADLRVLVPPPSFERPPAGGSDVLARIHSRGSIRVGFDADRAPDSRVRDFVRRYFADLARNWKLGLVLANVSATAAPAALASGKIDIEVTPVEPSAKVDAFPFFADPRGVLWQDWIVTGDADWDAGLRSYVTATLNTGRYGTLYEAVFGVQPSYESLRPLLFP